MHFPFLRFVPCLVGRACTGRKKTCARRKIKFYYFLLTDKTARASSNAIDENRPSLKQKPPTYIHASGTPPTAEEIQVDLQTRLEQTTILLVPLTNFRDADKAYASVTKKWITRKLGKIRASKGRPLGHLKYTRFRERFFVSLSLDSGRLSSPRTKLAKTSINGEKRGESSVKTFERFRVPYSARIYFARIQRRYPRGRRGDALLIIYI